MLLFLTILGITNVEFYLVGNSGNIDDVLKLNLQSKYAYLYDYKYINIPFTYYSLVLPSYANLDDLSVPSFTGSSESIINSAVSFINSFDYSYEQSNPYKMLKSGKGNCQAMSIVLDKIMKDNKIDSSIVVEEDHAYNLVSLDNKDYVIDLAKGKINIVEKDIEEVN